MIRALLIGLLAAQLVGCSDDEAPVLRSDKKLVVFGVDGMDPKLLRKYMAEGNMPNLAKLAERGGFVELGTSNPPQSPVAWSDFTTGQHWGGHGIYDFVHRDPRQLEPYLSTSRVIEADTTIEIGSKVFALGSGGVELLREGPAFWQDLERAGVPATVVRIPANFPPAKSKSTRSTAGMGTPDLLGTPGTFQLFTSDAEAANESMSGGILHHLKFHGQRASASLTGPTDPTSASGEAMSIPFDVLVDKKRPVALITIDGQRVVLKVGEWTEWLPIAFDPGLLGGEVPGMIRVFLAELDPVVRVYVTPVNIDPRNPAMPLSEPASYAAELAEGGGLFYTQGMPLDTKALVGGALSDEEALSQAEIALQEEFDLLDYAVTDFDGGLLFFYFSMVDQMSHVYWRGIEPDANEQDRKVAHVIPEVYQKVDAALGRAMEQLGDDVDILVMSDHGFGPYNRKVHLNTWLANRGYLATLPPEQRSKGSLGHIDWDNTQAYGLGLNQLFLNLRGREKNGVVDADRREVLLDRIERELLAWRDPDTGQRVVTRVTRPDVGDFDERAPDLLVGYNLGYRSSDSSALGQVGGEEIDDNTSKWSGDHCIDPSHVPGVLLSNRKVRSGVSLTDITPTILEYFEASPSAKLPGASVFEQSRED